MTQEQPKGGDRPAQLRAEAAVAHGIGQSLRSLAPVLADELQAWVKLQHQSGAIASNWERALAAAKQTAETDEEALQGAASGLMAMMAVVAGKRVADHGDQLIQRHAELLGMAAGIEEAQGGPKVEPNEPEP